MVQATACPHGAAALADSDAVWVWVEEWAWDVDVVWHIRMLTAQVCLMLRAAERHLMHRMAHPLIMDGKEKVLGADSHAPDIFLSLVAEGQGRDGGAQQAVPRFIKD